MEYLRPRAVDAVSSVLLELVYFAELTARLSRLAIFEYSSELASNIGPSIRESIS